MWVIDRIPSNCPAFRGTVLHDFWSKICCSCLCMCYALQFCLLQRRNSPRAARATPWLHSHPFSGATSSSSTQFQLEMRSPTSYLSPLLIHLVTPLQQLLEMGSPATLLPHPVIHLQLGMGGGPFICLLVCTGHYGNNKVCHCCGAFPSFSLQPS